MKMLSFLPKIDNASVLVKIAIENLLILPIDINPLTKKIQKEYFARIYQPNFTLKKFQT